MTIKVNRREALLTGVAAALPILAMSTGTPVAAASDYKPTVGVSTLGFGALTNAELAQELKENNITIIQLFLSQKDSNYWRYNSRNDVSAVDASRCKEIADTYRDAGIAIHSIGVYTNLIHGDEAERKANLEYFEAMFRIGADMDVHTFITEAGHYEPEGDAHGVPHYLKEEVWKQMVETGKALATLAEAHDATVLFEPFYRGFLATAKRVRLFIEDIGSPHARVLLDPANLIEFNDIEEMFSQLSPYIDCMHAKDRKLHVDAGVAAGQGDVNYDVFVAQAAKHAPHAPFILEYVGPDDYKQALKVLQDAIDRYNA
jgi:L-ribulose-5-phosphate 3-epimerase